MKTFFDYVFFISTSIVFLIFLIYIIGILFDKLIAKIGIRNISKRPLNTLIVVIGSMVGTALISGSLAMNDSFSRVQKKLVYENFGEIDYKVAFRDRKSFFASEKRLFDKSISILLKKELGDSIDGILNVLSFDISPEKQDESGLAILISRGAKVSALDYSLSSSFGTEKTNFNGINEVKRGEAVITNILANELEVSEGDFLSIFNQKREQKNLLIRKIYKSDGTIGIERGRTIFANEDEIREFFGVGEGLYNEIWISNKGNLLEGDLFFEQNKKKIEESNIFKFEAGNLYSDFIPSIDTTKHKVLKQSEETNILGFMFLGFSIFGILAGILLIVNIYSMLSEERKKELGILRAMGMSKFQLQRCFLYEGLIYSFFASFVGVFAGILVSKFLIGDFQDIIRKSSTFTGRNAIAVIKLEVLPRSMAIAFNLGFIVTFITTYISIRKISNLNIIEAIRDVPKRKEIKMPSIRYIVFNLKKLFCSLKSFEIRKSFKSFKNITFEVLKVLLQVFVILFFVIGIIKNNPYFLLVFTPVFTSLFFVKLKNILKKDWLSSLGYLVSILSIVFLSIKVESVSKLFSEEKNQFIYIFAFLVSSLLMIIFFLLLILDSLSIIVSIIKFIFNKFLGISSIVSFSLKYPGENKKRTGLTFAMFALVIFAVSSVKASLKINFDSFVKSASGYFGEYDGGIVFNRKDHLVENFEERIKSSKYFSDFPFSHVIKGGSAFVGFLDDNGSIIFVDTFEALSEDVGFDFLEKNSLRLAKKIDQNLSDKEVFKLLFDGENVILGANYLESYRTIWSSRIPNSDNIKKQSGLLFLPWESPSGIDVGDKISVFVNKNNGGKEKLNLRVVGIIEEDLSSPGFNVRTGIFGNYKTLKDLGVDLDSVKYKFSIKDGFDINEVNKSLQREFNKDFATIFISNVLIEAISSVLDSVTKIFESFLLFGLIVGIAGISVIAYRTVLERRQQIGMLRAIGFTKEQVSLGFLVEFASISFFGILIGFISSYISTLISIKAYETAGTIEKGVFSFPFTEVLILCFWVFAVSILFIIIPSLKISMLKPVEAIRYDE